MHGTQQAWGAALKAQLSQSTAEEAFKFLSDDAIQVTNKSDKALQLPKIMQFNQAVMQHMQHAAMKRLNAQMEAASSSRPSSARRLPLKTEASASSPAEGLLQQVARIKEVLELDAKLPPPSAIKQANAMLELPGEGSLKEQVRQVMDALGM
jgi:hypothetical protein